MMTKVVLEFGRAHATGPVMGSCAIPDHEVRRSPGFGEKAWRVFLKGTRMADRHPPGPKTGKRRKFNPAVVVTPVEHDRDSMARYLAARIRLLGGKIAKEWGQLIPLLHRKEGLMEKLLTAEEICNRLQISQRTLFRWLAKSVIPCIRVGSVVRFKEDDVDKALKQFRHGHNGDSADVQPKA